MTDATSIKNFIDFDAFDKVDIRTGTVLTCEKVHDSVKLLKLSVDFGALGIRQILTGMAKWYTEEDMVNKQMLFVVNLEPRKMANLESQGMLLSIGTNKEEKPTLIIPDEPTQNGCGVM